MTKAPSSVSAADVQNIYDLPLLTLVDRARTTHLAAFPRHEIQASSLLSIKTGGCPENCAYCPQSAHHDAGVEKTKMMDRAAVIEAARRAKDMGATRFCMGAAWRSVRDGPEFDHVVRLVEDVHHEGLEVCCTLGMLNEAQARRLKDAGLYAYNHNIDTSREFYERIVQTRTYDDRLDTIRHVRAAGLTVCTGGILGMGESHHDRRSLIHQLLSFDPVPESITINSLVSFEGTPLENRAPLDPLEIVRVIATIRVLAPRAMIRLSAGRLAMSAEAQFLSFMCGANSIFLGDKLLTSPNPEVGRDREFLNQLGFDLTQPKPPAKSGRAPASRPGSGASAPTAP